MGRGVDRDPFLTSNGVFTVSGGPTAAYFTTDPDHVVWALLGGGHAFVITSTLGGRSTVWPAFLVEK